MFMFILFPRSTKLILYLSSPLNEFIFEFLFKIQFLILLFPKFRINQELKLIQSSQHQLNNILLIISCKLIHRLPQNFLKLDHCLLLGQYVRFPVVLFEFLAGLGFVALLEVIVDLGVVLCFGAEGGGCGAEVSGGFLVQLFLGFGGCFFFLFC